MRIRLRGRPGTIQSPGGNVGRLPVGSDGLTKIVDLPHERATGLIKAGCAIPADPTPMKAPKSGRLLWPGIEKHLRDWKTAEINTDPMLWVVTPTKDRCDAVAKQVELVLGEDIPSGKLMMVVVNDGGARPEIIQDQRVVLIDLAQSKGPNYARDMGIRMAPPGAVVVEADDHDYIEAGALRHVVAAFSNPATHVVYGDFWRINSAGERWGTGGFNEKGEYAPGMFLKHGAVHTGLRAYRKGLYSAVGGYRMEEVPAGDYGLFLRFEALLQGKGIVHLARPLCSYTVDATGISMARAIEQAEVARRLRCLGKEGLLFAESMEADPARGYSVRPEPKPEDFTGLEIQMLQDAKVAPNPEVVVVTTAYRTKRFIETWVNSLDAAGKVPAVIVENGDPGVASAAMGRPHVAVLRLKRNAGYGHALNVAAAHAMKWRPKYLLVLCSDAWLTEGALDGMVKGLEDEAVGIVGNTHLYPTGAIQSEGSEFVWTTQQYSHVGRNIKQDPVGGPLPRERDMVTFACAMVKATVWEELGGIDERYRKSYWEDADFCCRARAAGWKILWTGEPATRHHCGGAGARDEVAWQANARLFRSRFSDTGLVDKFRRSRGIPCHDRAVVGCMIVCNEAEFVEATLESAYDFCDRIVVVVGGTEAAHRAGICSEIGWPTDGTLALLDAFPDPNQKLDIIMPPNDKPWPHKLDMRTTYTTRLKAGDWMLMLDADEVFTEAGLWRLSRHMHFGEAVFCGHWLIWNNLDTIGTGPWDRYPQLKAVQWRDGMHYGSDVHLMLHNKHVLGHPAVKLVDASKERLYVHYAWVRPLEKIERKVRYYEEKPAVVKPPRRGYFKKVFLGWREDPEKVEREYGTHPGGMGETAVFPGRHPEPVMRRLRNGTIGGTGW